MESDFNIFRLFRGGKNEFRPYYEKENSFHRLLVIHSIAAFIITPIYSLFVYYSDVPFVYFYLGLSYTALFPIYLLICRFVPFFYDKLIHFFIIHLFGMTFVAFNSLLENNYELKELFCFYGLYSVTIIVMQRWYPAVLYNLFTLSLVIYGFQVVEIVDVSKELILGVFIVLVLSSTVVLFARQRMINAVEDYSQYLRRIMNNPGSGYILFNLTKGMSIIDFNGEAAKLLTVQDPTNDSVANQLLEYLSKEDRDLIKNLKVGRKFVKTINYVRFNRTAYVELSINILSLKNGFYWLCRINDVTDEINKREELELNEKKYRNLYYKNKAGVFTTNRESTIINGNDAFFEMLEGTVGMGDALFTDKQLDEWEFIIESLGEKESIQSYQTQFVLQNKSQKTFIFSWYLDAQTNYIEGSVIDLTTIQRASQALKQSEEKYRLIYEESNDVILLLDGDKIINVNRRAVQLFGKPEEALLDNSLFNLSIDRSPESRTRYNDFLERLNNMRTTKFDWLFDGNGRVVEAEVSLIEIVMGDQLYYQCVIHDSTEQNKNLREIDQNRRNLENILENNPEGILIVRDGKVMYRNSEIVRVLGKRFSLNKLFVGDDQERFNQQLDIQRESGTRENVQLELIGRAGKRFSVDVTLVSTIYEDDAATLIIIKDISVQNRLAKEKLRAEVAEETNKKLADEIMERIRAEKLLQEQFLRTKAILDSSSNTFLLTLSLEQTINSFNTHFETYVFQLFNKRIKAQMHFDTFFEDVFSQGRRRLFRRTFSKVKRGDSNQFEAMLQVGDREIWWEIFMNPIFDTEGFVAEISLVAHDISEKKKTDIEIVESLKEKEILLKEIHHRVKNNLQVISSILNLQSSFVDDDKTLGILQESRNRIRSMAIIHENLYRTEDFSSINFAGYLQNLTANLIASYRINEQVILEPNLEDIDLVLDQAIPCGLLVNELITNSLKYAWKPGQRGVITLELKELDGCVHLCVADNGVGLPAKFEEMNSDTLGLQLVITLVEQLEGEVSVECETGTKYLIKFDNVKPKPRIDVKN